MSGDCLLNESAFQASNQFRNEAQVCQIVPDGTEAVFPIKPIKY